MKKVKKIVNNIYNKELSYENINKMYNVVRRTCKNKSAVFKYSVNKSVNNMIIYRVLKNKCYVPSKFKLFVIFEPKIRLVMSQTITDKIVNHFVTNYYLIPYLENRLVDQNVATRKNKGSNYANKLILDYINEIRLKYGNEDIYCLKIDISKYFYNINHEILIKKLENIIKDKDIINIIKTIISETNKPYINETIKEYNKKYNSDIPIYNYGTGLSIGAMTSQFLAIFYLNDLDHYIKEILKVKYYIRYMDDFVILDVDKEKLKYIKKEIEKEIIKLKLKLNPKSNIYKLSSGISFLGFSYNVNDKLKINYRKKTYIKIKKKLLYLKDNNIVKYYRTYASYYGYLNKIIKQERVFKMKLSEQYKYFKEIYPNGIVILKEGIFYKTFEVDAKILWNIFNYNWNNKSIGFGVNSLEKVITTLNEIEISYVIINNEEDKYIKKFENNIYDAYAILANNKYEKEMKKIELHNLLDNVINKTNCNFELIFTTLNEILK